MKLELHGCTKLPSRVAFDLYAFARYAAAIAPAGLLKLGILAGGAPRTVFDGTKVKDFDVFFRSNSDYNEACWMFFESGDFTIVSLSPTQAVFRSSVNGTEWNLIGFDFVLGPNDLIETFDFTCCAMALMVDRDHVQFYAHPAAIRDAMEKVLRPLTQKSLVRTRARMRRYRSYGYRKVSQFFRQWAASPPGRGGY